jgi:hypothetical protein
MIRHIPHGWTRQRQDYLERQWDIAEEQNQKTSAPTHARGIVGMCGPAGAGKDTLCSVLVAYLRKHLFAAHADYLAKPLYAAVSAMTGIPVEVLQDRRYKDSPIDWPGAPRGLGSFTPRRLLQLTGHGLVRNHISEYFFIDRIKDRAERTFKEAGKGPAVFFVSDVRYENESEACDVVVEVVRDGILYAGDHPSALRLPNHCIDVVVDVTSQPNYPLIAEVILNKLYLEGSGEQP